MTEIFKNIMEATGLFSEIAQLGIVFAILVAIIFVLSRRVIKLESDNKSMIDNRLEEVKEMTLIIKDATDTMNKVIEKL